MLPRTKIRVARSEARYSRNTSIRVFGLDGGGRPFHLPALTMDVSRHGARIRGVNCWDLPGETVGVRCGAEKARFSVVWVGKPGTIREQEVGLFAMEPDKYIWDIVPPQGEPLRRSTDRGLHNLGLQDKSSRGDSAPESFNRRRSARYRVVGKAQVRSIGDSKWHWSILCDLSGRGAYMEMPTPLPVGSQMEASIALGGIQLQLKAQVTSCIPKLGMGIHFTEMSPHDHLRLQRVIALLANSQPLL